MKAWLRCIVCFLLFSNNPIQAFQITDQISLDWLSSGALQCEHDNSGQGYSWLCRSGLVFRPELTYTLTSQDTLSSVLGFAAGNSLNNVTPFNLQPWNADLESAVRHINGRNRSFILTAAYSHKFIIDKNNSIVSTSGIVDSTDFFISNVYANDEYAQFMSGPLSFGQNVIVPSYDYGTVLQWFSKWFTVTGVYMNVGKNTRNTVQFNFYAIQLLFKVNTAWGKGHYRFMVDTTDSQLITVNNTKKSDNLIMASFDQEFGSVFGGWVRFGRQSKDLVGSFANFYSGGINVKGSLWNRDKDDVGIGVVHVSSGASPMTSSLLFETYYHFVINRNLAVTPDIQYQINHFDNMNVLKGIIAGLRATITA